MVYSRLREFEERIKRKRRITTKDKIEFLAVTESLKHPLITRQLTRTELSYIDYLSHRPITSKNSMVGTTHQLQERIKRIRDRIRYEHSEINSLRDPDIENRLNEIEKKSIMM